MLAFAPSACWSLINVVVVVICAIRTALACRLIRTAAAGRFASLNMR